MQKKLSKFKYRTFFILSVIARLRKATISFVTFVHLSVRPSVCTTPTGRIFVKIRVFFKICPDNSIFITMTRITGTLHKTNKHFLSYLAQFFLEQKKCFRKKLVQKIETHILCEITFYENSVIYEMMWKYSGPRQDTMTIWRMRNVCWIPRATNTHSGSVKLNAFHCKNGCTNARASMSSYTYFGCRVRTWNVISVVSNRGWTKGISRSRTVCTMMHNHGQMRICRQRKSTEQCTCQSHYRCVPWHNFRHVVIRPWKWLHSPVYAIRSRLAHPSPTDERVT